ncbi:MAG TPA: recombinase family protein, partial [Polyangia bacterium]|nr:recombinase family protein [Polyangia bacterium]
DQAAARARRARPRRDHAGDEHETGHFVNGDQSVNQHPEKTMTAKHLASMDRAVSNLRAATYHRVSTLDQDATNARDELRSAAIGRGFSVALEIEEKGSGARNDRPGLARVLEAARRGEVTAVFVWKLDRFGRSALDLLANIQALEDAGCRFIAITQGIDIKPDGDPMSRLLLTLLAAIAEYERELIRERTRLGLDKARKAGKRLGRPVSTSAPQARAVVSLRASGASWSAVAAQLGCTVAAARRAVERTGQRLAENGGAI